jgi:hypothetical protein
MLQVEFLFSLTFTRFKIGRRIVLGHGDPFQIASLVNDLSVFVCATIPAEVNWLGANLASVLV